MAIQELLSKIEDENLRNQIKAEYDAANTKAGEHGRKLIEKDGEINRLKDAAANYDKAFKQLKEAGIDPQEIPGHLEKLGYVKTLENDYKLTQEILKEKEKKLKEYETKERTAKIRDAISKVFEDERKSFKKEDGTEIKVFDRFINTRENELYADIDVSNEVLLRERAKKVLRDALGDQEAFMKELGFQGAPVPPVPENNGFNSGEAPIDVKKVMHDTNAVTAIVMARAKNKR